MFLHVSLYMWKIFLHFLFLSFKFNIYWFVAVLHQIFFCQYINMTTYILAFCATGFLSEFHIEFWASFFSLENIKNVFKDVQGEKKQKIPKMFFYKGIPFSLKLLVRKFWSERNCLKYAHEMFRYNNIIDIFVLKYRKKEKEKQWFSSFITNMCTLVYFCAWL